MKLTTLVIESALLIFLISTSFITKPVIVQQTEASQDEEIKKFVRQHYIDGLSYEETIKFGKESTPVLVEMLKDETEKPYWSNIVVALGMIGDKKAVDHLIEFINKDFDGTIPSEVYNAKTSAIISMGYIINRTKSKKGLNFLIDSLDPNTWHARGLTWTSPYQANIDDRDIQLSSMAVLGLALSGHADAEIALKSLKKPGKSQKATKFRLEINTLIDEALNEHKIISENGLMKYEVEIKKQRRHK